MTVSLHAASVPVFDQLLGGLADVLKKAEAHATERKIEPNAYLQLRLYPDMFPLVRQVQIACDFAKSVSARLAQAEVPAWEDNEASFEDLQVRIARTQAYLASLEAQNFKGAEARDIVLRPGTPKEKHLTGQAYLLNYGLPPASFEGSAAREIVLRPGTPKEKRLLGQAYLSNYGLPQFFFHVTTTYALLRQAGIEIGKRDFMGQY